MVRPARILITDDEPNTRLVFRTALETLGYAVAEAADGESALAALDRETFDVMLLDLRLPGVDGLEVLRRLRDAGHSVPTIMVTAYGSVPDAVAAMKLGAIDFLPKPVAADALRAAVAEVLRRHAAARPAAVAAEPVKADDRFAANLADAKRALNNRWFDEAEVYLRQALGLRPDSAEAHNLLGVLHELRNEHDASYREYKAALKADRHYEPARHNMTRYYERFTFGSSQVPLDTGTEP